MTLQIRTLELTEIETLVDWAAQEGWNPGRFDARPFQATDPDGFLGGFLNDELVTGISAVRYGATFGFIGLFITRPDLRSRGYGRAIWNAAIDHLDGRTIGLDGVPEQQLNYQSKGFAKAYGTTRYTGSIRQRHATPDGIHPLNHFSIDKLYPFDRRYFPESRKQFLQSWFDAADQTLICMRNGELAGYGVARSCRVGHKIGPIFARNHVIARDLLIALAQHCDGEIQIDVPDYQSAFVNFLGDMGLSAGFSTARMYRGAVPEIDQSGVFAITSLELG